MTDRKGRLDGLVAIVTGAGSSGPGIGNGRATAILFAREGAKVALVDRVEERARETADMIGQEGGECFVFAADVTKADDCKAAVEAAVARYGRLDILDNNVGIGLGGSVVDVDDGAWDRLMTTNVKSMMLMSKHAVPAMAASGGGSIINISSLSALRPRGLTPYSVSNDCLDEGDGRRPCASECARELHCAWPGLYADGGARHDRRTPRCPGESCTTCL